MLEDWQRRVEIIKSKGRPLSDIHLLGGKEVSIIYWCPLPTLHCKAKTTVERKNPPILKIFCLLPHTYIVFKIKHSLVYFLVCLGIIYCNNIHTKWPPNILYYVLYFARKFYYSVLIQDDYYAELTKESGIDRVPPVMFKIRKCDTEAKMENLYTYRNYNYKVIDNNTFSRTIGKIAGFTDKEINV